MLCYTEDFFVVWIMCLQILISQEIHEIKVLLSLRFFFLFPRILSRSRLFGKRCNKAEYFSEEGIVCNLLDQSFWDQSNLGQRMMILFNW